VDVHRLPNEGKSPVFKAIPLDPKPAAQKAHWVEKKGVMRHYPGTTHHRKA
jgi:hypothetical protein